MKTLTLVSILSVLVPAVGAQPSQPRPATRPIELSLVDQAGRRAPLPGSLALDYNEAVVGDTDTLDSVLRSRGIRPDADAYTLLYDLNPTLTDANQGIARQSLVFPQLPQDPAITAGRKGGSLVAIGLDRDLKTELAAKSKAIDDALGALGSNPAERCAAAPPPLVTVEAEVARAPSPASLGAACLLRGLSRELLRGTGPALPREVLADLVDDASVVAEAVGGARGQGGQWKATKEQAASIAAASADLRIKQPRLAQVAGGGAPLAYPRVRVVVRVVGRDAKPVTTPIRINYVHRGSRQRPTQYHQFSALSSPFEESLYESFYTFWATDGETMTPITPDLEVKVEKDAGSVKTVDLLLK